MYTKIDKLASAIKNHVDSGLRGFHSNNTLSLELIADEIINERLSLIKTYAAKSLIQSSDLYTSINCIPVNCQNIKKCNCRDSVSDTPTLHFEIPQLLTESNLNPISYIGSSDKLNPFLYYYTFQSFKNHKYRKRGKDKPYVWIDTTPNENGMYDCWVFNAPLLKLVSIIGIFKDPRQLDLYSCCTEQQSDNMSFLDGEVVKTLSQKYIYYYRSAVADLSPNDQSYQPG